MGGDDAQNVFIFGMCKTRLSRRWMAPFMGCETEVEKALKGEFPAVKGKGKVAQGGLLQEALHSTLLLDIR